MKKLGLLIFILILSIAKSFSQYITLSDMITIAGYENWSDANTFLINKGWEYYGSSSDEYDNQTVSWSYERNYYDRSKATAWVDWSMINLIFYTTPYVKIQVHTQDAYKRIHSSLSSYGFKLDETEVEEGVAVSTYKTEKYTLLESTKSSDDYNLGPSNIYSFELYINYEYSPSQNGYKKVYHEGTNQVSMTYTLVKGKKNGLHTEYDEHGKKVAEVNFINGIRQGKYEIYLPDDDITVKGTFVNDKSEGSFSIFNPYGVKTVEGSFKQDSLHGKRTQYSETGRIIKMETYEMGVLHGPADYYYYYNDTVSLKNSGNFSYGKATGKWTSTVSNEKTKKTYSNTYTTRLNGVFEGPFKDFSQDSLIFGAYKNGKLSGPYVLYFDWTHRIFGGIPSCDSSNCSLMAMGSYYDGEKTGYWRNYAVNGEVLSDGYFKNNLEDGVWNFYNCTTYECKNLDSVYTVDFGHLLLRKETYAKGLLNGPAQYYYHIKSENYKCKNIHTPDDSCYKTTLQRVDIIINYKNGLRDGLYTYKGENGELIAQGNYIDDNRDGAWREDYEFSDGSEGYVLLNYSAGKPDGKIEFFNSSSELQTKGNYIKGERSGEWTYYNNGNVSLQRTFSQDKMNGPARYFDELGALILYENYSNDELDSLAVYDVNNTGKPVSSQKILSRFGSQYLVRDREYRGDTTFMQTMTMNSKTAMGSSEGVLEGPYAVLIKNIPFVQGQYTNNKKDGVWYDYFYDQDVYIVSKYVDDVYQYEEFFRISTRDLYKGKVKLPNLFSPAEYEVCTIKDGKRNGTSVFYSGKEKVFKVKYKNGVKVE